MAGLDSLLIVCDYLNVISGLNVNANQLKTLGFKCTQTSPLIVNFKLTNFVLFLFPWFLLPRLLMFSNPTKMQQHWENWEDTNDHTFRQELVPQMADQGNRTKDLMQQCRLCRRFQYSSNSPLITQ